MFDACKQETTKVKYVDVKIQLFELNNIMKDKIFTISMKQQILLIVKKITDNKKIYKKYTDDVFQLPLQRQQKYTTDTKKQNKINI